MAKQARCRLYLITPPVFEPVSFTEALERALNAGDVACLQVRLKDVDDDTIKRAVERLLPVTQRHDVALIVNDRPDLAAALGADGAHVGQEDMPFAEARRLLGPGKIVGVTCHDSRHLAMEAGEAGADYVAFGAFYPTRTKVPKTKAEPELLTWWSDIFEIPCVAIGGITTENCVPLIAAGADFIAVSSGVWDVAEGPAAAVAAFNRLMR